LVNVNGSGVKVCPGAKAEQIAWKIPTAQRDRELMVDEAVEEEEIVVHISRSGAGNN
jgi:hypothetical protein